MERLDKILVSQGAGSRKEVQKLIRSKSVRVNGETVLKPELKLEPESAVIEVNGRTLSFKKHLYLMLNKPAGYVSATEDNLSPTVLELIPDEYKRSGLFPAGRLDKDSEGLLIITDDGEFAHRMLSPRSDIVKRYYVRLSATPSEEDKKAFEDGIVFKDGTKCLPAGLEISGEKEAYVEIREGKFHQVKKMFLTRGINVNYLQRISIGSLKLDGNLPKGSCRELTNTEKDAIFIVK